MKPEWSEERLNALVDDEMTPADAAELLERLPADAALRERVCQLQLTKEFVRHAYASIEPPRAARSSPHWTSQWRRAALVVVFAAGSLFGWVAHDGPLFRSDKSQAYVDAPAVVEPGRVILHVSSASSAQGLAALLRAEGLIEAARESGQTVTIEIVANGSGLDLLRTGVSPYAQRIEAMRAAYPALTLVACGQTVQKLREAGEDVRLLPGTVIATSALDQIVSRMQQGWTYLRM